MKGGREEGGRHSEGSLRKPLTIWHIVSRAVSRINRFKPCSGRTNTDGCCHSSCFLGRFYQKKKKKPVLEINALLKSLQSYVSDRLHLQSSAGRKKTRRQSARSVITETITHNKLLLMLVDSVFRPREWITAVRMKLKKKKKKKTCWEELQSLINNLKISSGFGVFGKAEPPQRGSACWMLDVILLLFNLFFIFFYSNKDRRVPLEQESRLCICNQINLAGCGGAICFDNTQSLLARK